jgi:hypothetical protein
VNPYRALHDCLEQMTDKRLGMGRLCDCAMGVLLSNEMREYRSTVIVEGTMIIWRSDSIGEALTPLGFTPEIAYEVERMNDRIKGVTGWERYTRVMAYLKEKSE